MLGGGYSLYRAQHLGTALEYAHGSISVLKPVILGFNANGSPTPQELPIWQATTGMVFKLTGSLWYGWANLVSLAFFVTALWPLYQIARQYVEERAAWWVLAFFLTQPLIVVYAGKAATDGFCLTVMIWFLFFSSRLIRDASWRWWLPTALFACVGAISKLPFFMVVGLVSFFMLLVNPARGWRPWVQLATVGIAATAVFGWWTHYCDLQLSQGEFPYTELRLSKNPFMFWWYFGDFGMRLKLGMWITGGWRFLHASLGSLVFVSLAVFTLLRPGNHLAKAWLAATLLMALVFTHLVLIHWHYYLIACPAVALLCGTTLARWEVFWSRELPRPRLLLPLAGLTLVCSAISGLITMNIAMDYDYFPSQISSTIQQNTQPEDRLIVYKCDPEWPSELLFLSKRQGLFVATFNGDPHDPVDKGLQALLGDETSLQRLQSLGYTKLVLVSESPVRFAVEASKPGSHRQRIFYPATVSPKVDAWPVVYRSEDILIRDIPQRH